MNLDARLVTRFGAWTVLGCLVLAAGCSSSSDDGNTSGGGDGGGGGGGDPPSGQSTFSCGQEGKYCIEYTGNATNVARIRDATKCTEQGAVEGTGCPKQPAIGCKLPPNGSTGTSGTQYYYGTHSDDDIASLKMTCERTGGTFTTL